MNQAQNSGQNAGNANIGARWMARNGDAATTYWRKDIAGVGTRANDIRQKKKKGERGDMIDRETREMIAGQLIRQGAGYQRRILDIEAKQERPGEINAMIRRLQDEANVWAAKLEATAQTVVNLKIMQWGDYMAACREAADTGDARAQGG